MKYDWTGISNRERVEVVARFGDTEIIKFWNGRFEIRGGTEAERVKANDWLRQFIAPALLTLRKIG